LFTFETQDLLRLAYEHAAAGSHDNSTHTGAVLVTRDRAYVFPVANRFPEGVEVTPERLNDRDLKLQFMEHAERWAIYQAARFGRATEGATMYAPWFACADCARAIACAGIEKVVGHQAPFDRTPERWLKSIEIGNTILDEAGVIREYYDGPIGGVELLFNKEMWSP